jgi:succinyl-CoA synthetase alpha subunit
LAFEFRYCFEFRNSDFEMIRLFPLWSRQMISGYVVRKNEYHDSVFLMRIARRISEQKGVLQAAALMGTEKNKGLLAEIGIGGKEIGTATPGDLIIAVQTEDQETLTALLGNVEGWLHPSPDRPGAIPIRTLEEALSRQPGSNLAVISVPGEYAAREARRALERGLNVFLFSDHVPMQDERSLKEFARGKGLIVMGPDCGTAIIGGKGIGFANAVRRGSIGVIGASGTGIQEFTSLVHHAGCGISQAIGTGSRDLADEIGGISLLSALGSLESDPQTRVIAILSKPPGTRTLAQLLPKIQACSKPVVACFLGETKSLPRENHSLQIARTLDETAAEAVKIATGGEQRFILAESSVSPARLQREKVALKSGQKYLRGIFAGGTFCYQTQQILLDAGIRTYSNVPLNGNPELPDPYSSLKHTLVDMGADEFTSGRPHPMIDSSQRRERILTEARDPEVAVLLLDFILGFNASADPAGELIPAITRAKEEVRRRGGFLSVVVSVCGTEEDVQDFGKQAKRLEGAGALVFPSNAQSAGFCATLIQSLQGEPDARQSQ